MKGRFVYATYGTHDGGISWQIEEQHERTDSKVEMSSLTSKGVLHVASDEKHGIEVRTVTSKISVAVPKDLPRRGSVAVANFVDQVNGWLVYQALKCYKFEKPESGSNGFFEPEKNQRGSRCVDGAVRNDLMTTEDGGNTFRVITPGSPREPVETRGAQ